MTEQKYKRFTFLVSPPGEVVFDFIVKFIKNRSRYYIVNYNEPVDKTTAWCDFVKKAKQRGYYENKDGPPILCHEVNPSRDVKIIDCY